MTHAPIFDILPEGRRNALPLALLCDIFGMDSRTARKEIERERKAGAPILSTTTPPGGYYRSRDTEELRCFVRSMERRAVNISSATFAARRELEARERTAGR